MRPKSSFGVALLLATLFLLQPVATCAAMFKPADSSAHSCCSRNTQPLAPKPNAQCCMVSSAAAGPTVPTGIEAGIGEASPATGQIRIGIARFDPLVTASRQFSAPDLFIQFRQLLI
jgi:hypothetical protein